MQVLTRSTLAAFLTGPSMDPDGTFAVEMAAFATAILADSAAPLFVYSDSENGGGPEVQWPDYVAQPSADLLPLTENGPNGYYGVTSQRCDPVYGEGRAIYNCYLAGCPAQSAAGFTVTAAVWGVDPE